MEYGLGDDNVIIYIWEILNKKDFSLLINKLINQYNIKLWFKYV